MSKTPFSRTGDGALSRNESQRRGLFYGWYIVAATAALAVFGGGVLFYGFSAYLKPISGDFGWGRAEMALAYGLLELEGGAMAPILGWIIDRYGTRIPMVVGASIGGTGFILLSRMDSLVTFYFGFFVIALGFSAFFVAPTVAVANWFRRKRSLAMGLAVTGYGLSGILVPLLVWIISQYGWRTTLFAIGIAVWALGLPISLVIRHRPENHGYLPDGDEELTPDTGAILGQPTDSKAQHVMAAEASPKNGVEMTATEALRTKAFWLFAAVFGLSWVGVGAIAPHLIAYLSGPEVGLSDETAALVITGMTLGSVVGRLGFGFLGDFIDKRYIIGGCFAGMAVGTFIFATISEPWHLIPFLLIFGPSYGGPVPLRLAIQGDYFGTKAFALISGLMMIPATFVGFFSPIFAGWMFDTTGSYRLAYTILAAITAVGIPFILLAKPPQPSALVKEGDNTGILDNQPHP